MIETRPVHLSRIIDNSQRDSKLEQVKRAIAQADTADRFGYKVYLDTIRSIATDAEILGWARQGKLELARADLVHAMDWTRLQASHIHSINSDYHLVVDPARL